MLIALAPTVQPPVVAAPCAITAHLKVSPLCSTSAVAMSVSLPENLFQIAVASSQLSPTTVASTC